MKKTIITAAATMLLAAPAFAAESGGHGDGHATAAAHGDTHGAGGHGHDAGGPACTGFGPQAPRDIDNMHGKNTVNFVMAPPASEMNLCNIHFHKNAEHKAKAFSVFAGEGDGHGYLSGYQCNDSKHLSKAEMAPTQDKICDSAHGDLKPGDTIEVHWVYSSCDIEPGPSLGSCLSDSCSNPQLRVESQVFTLVNDANALDFNKLRYQGYTANGLHQAKALPTGTGNAVEFLGSTTGPSYSEHTCSPYQVTWAVRPNCAKVDINTVGEFCKGNVFKEDHAHGVRTLVTNPDLLSTIH